MRASQRVRRGLRGLIAIGTAAVVLTTACGSPSTQGPVTKPTVPGGAATPQAGGRQLINGAGATFPFPLYSRWFYEYAKVDPLAQFNYQSIGSGGGIKQIKEKTVEFAGSDAILSDQDRKDVAPAVLQMLPTVAGAVVPTYNLKELAGKAPLVMSGSVLADIFQGKIKKWNDPALATLNAGVALPDRDIVVVHRSDGSGTTSIFTDYLAAVSVDWSGKVGKGTSVEWPLGLGGKGNEGVAGTVGQNQGAIGYVELAYARQNGMAYANIRNAQGAVVEATMATVSSAMADFASQMPDTLARSIVNAPGANSWPIVGYTYLIVYGDQSDCTKASKVVQFFKWALSDSGSKFASDLDYVPLPAALRQQVLDRLGKLTCQGKSIPG
jgi:phosphate transport system substrate-binding protein